MSISAQKKIALEIERRQQILSVALRMFYTNGYKKTSMAQIAQRAGISKGLIYHYFKNKAELLFAYEKDLDACLSEIKSFPSAKMAIYEFGKRFLQTEADESGYIPPLQVYVLVFIKGELDDPEYMNRNPLYKDFGKTFFGPLFAKGMKAQEFRSGDPFLMGDFYWHYLLGCVIEITETKHSRKSTVPDLTQVLAMFE